MYISLHTIIRITNIVNYDYIRNSVMFMSASIFELYDEVVSVLVDISPELIKTVIIPVPPKDDSGNTGEKQIDDFHFFIFIS